MSVGCKCYFAELVPQGIISASAKLQLLAAEGSAAAQQPGVGSYHHRVWAAVKTGKKKIVEIMPLIVSQEAEEVHWQQVTCSEKQSGSGGNRFWQVSEDT